MKRFYAAVLTMIFCAVASLPVFAIEAKVLSVTGKVQIQRQGNWRDINVGDRINQGEMIQTGFKSEAVLQITSANQNSKITVEALSRITIEQLVENGTKDSVSVNLTVGSVKSEVKKTQDRRTDYTVRSPVATASVRGTGFRVASFFGKDSVNAWDGTVWATNNSNAVIDSNSTRMARGVYEVKKNQKANFSRGKDNSPFLNAVQGANELDRSTDTAGQSEGVTTSGSGSSLGSSDNSQDSAQILLDVEVIR